MLTRTPTFTLTRTRTLSYNPSPDPDPNPDPSLTLNQVTVQRHSRGHSTRRFLAALPRAREKWPGYEAPSLLKQHSSCLSGLDVPHRTSKSAKKRADGLGGGAGAQRRGSVGGAPPMSKRGSVGFAPPPSPGLGKRGSGVGGELTPESTKRYKYMTGSYLLDGIAAVRTIRRAAQRRNVRKSVATHARRVSVSPPGRPERPSPRWPCPSRRTRARTGPPSVACSAGEPDHPDLP